MRVPRLVEPTVAELRLLRPAALALWRTLIRCRDRGDIGEHEWFPAKLRDLARWSRTAYSTTKAALGELRSAGLVATSRCTSSRWIRCRDTDKLTTVNANEENLYLVAGSLSTRAGIDRIMFPSRAWRAFVSTRTRVAPWRRDLPTVEWRREWTAEALGTVRPNEPGFSRKTKRLGRVPSTSVYNCISVEEKKETSKKAADAADLSHAALLIDLAAADDDDEALSPLKPVGSKFTVLGGGPRLTPLGPRSETPFIMPDKHDPQPSLVEWISVDQVPELKARLIVDSYRRAVKEVYGQEWWHFSKGDLTKSKFYSRLLTCAEQMIEHGVAPMHWAIWRLKWFVKGPRFNRKPPPIWVVMCGKTVSKRAGWFRKEYVLPSPVFVPDPIIAEQNLRNKEAARRWRGFTGEGVFMVFPQWYVDMREKEIKGGITDPHDLWPMKPNSLSRRVRR